MAYHLRRHAFSASPPPAHADALTIAISLKVNDGLVLASDSASTLVNQQNGLVVNVYNNANKIFNLRKGFPIGAVTWGAGAIGSAAISTLAKDLRRRFSGDDQTHTDWRIEGNNYSIQQVAERLRAFMYEELYVPAFANQPTKPELGFAVVGYSSGGAIAEGYNVFIDNQGQCAAPAIRHPTNAGSHIAWNGQAEAIARLILGFSQALRVVLEQDLAVPVAQIQQAIDVIQSKLATPLVEPAMPIQDAIDLAAFLVDMTIKYQRFMPGADTVGGPIELAAITKHEGFKWVRRKHYFQAELNPGG
jgi:hypothetical protein